MPVTSAAAVVAAIVTIVPSPSAPAPTAAAAATAFRAPSASSARLAASIVGIDDLAASPGPTASIRRRAVVVEARASVVADDPILVLAAALGQMVGDALPLPQVGVDQPVDQLADLAFDLLRRVGDDLLLEPLLHAAAIEQVHHPADAHRVVEVVVAAALHLEQDAVDVRHAELEIARQVLLVDRRAAARPRRASRNRPSAAPSRSCTNPAWRSASDAPTPSGLSSLRCTRPGASSVVAM